MANLAANSVAAKPQEDLLGTADDAQIALAESTNRPPRAQLGQREVQVGKQRRKDAVTATKAVADGAEAERATWTRTGRACEAAQESKYNHHELREQPFTIPQAHPPFLF